MRTVAGVRPDPPESCEHCEDVSEERHWYWHPGAKYGYWYCRMEKRRKQREYRANRRASRSTGMTAIWDDRLRQRWYLYGYNDRHKGRICEVIEWEAAEQLMRAPCAYCGREGSGGLDRMDSQVGHTAANVVPCCSTCNFIMLDLPYAVKVCLAEGMTRARSTGLLDDWIHPRLRRPSRTPNARP